MRTARVDSALVAALRQHNRSLRVRETVVAKLAGLADDLVGRRDLLELLLDGLVTGVQVRMQLFRELAVRLLDLVRARGLGDLEDFVRISHWPWLTTEPAKTCIGG